MATDLAGAIGAYPDGMVQGGARSAAALISRLSGDGAGAARDAGAAASLS
jgi:hypothetical protein